MSDVCDFEVFDSKLAETVLLSNAAAYMDEHWLDSWGCIQTTLDLIAGATAQAAEIARLRADVERKDEALRAASRMLSWAKTVAWTNNDHDTPFAQDLVTAHKRVTAALADTADNKRQDRT